MSTAIEGLGQEKLHFRVLTSPVQVRQQLHIHPLR